MKYYMQQRYCNNSAKVRVYTSSTQGGRKYMEDEYAIVNHKCPLKPPVNSNNADVLQQSFMFFGIFDGHGGDMAAKYSRDNLCSNIIRQREFWSGDDKKVCLAIHRGFVRTQRNMLNEVGKWPKTTSGLPSTAGTTASVVFIMNGNYYTGHVGDSRIVLGRQDLNSNKWIACPMTRDHKPESPREKKRIEAAGGQVLNKSGVGRVVWNRPKPCLNPSSSNVDSQSFDVIPFLAVARALGDLWSLNKSLDTFIVSPEPDVHCIPVDRADRCLLLASDGLWNMMNNQAAIKVVQDFEESHKPYCLPAIGDLQQSHATQLLDVCMNRWSRSRYRADNTTVLTIMFDLEEDDEEDDFSEIDSEVTESEEEIDPEAQNRIPTRDSSYLSASTCHSFYDFIHDLYDSSLDPDDDTDGDLFNEKTNFNFVGETIREMNLTSQETTENDHESEVSSIISQLIDQVSTQVANEGTLLKSSNYLSPTALSTSALSKHCKSSQPESFNELTDDQISGLLFTQRSNWDPNNCHMQNNYNTVLTIDRMVLGFKEYLLDAKSFCGKPTTAKLNQDQLVPSQMCKVVLHESQNTISSSATPTESSCDNHPESLVTNGQAGLDLILKRAPTPPQVKSTEPTEMSVSNSSPVTTHQPLSSLNSNSSPYSYRLPKLSYKRKFDFVNDLSTSVVTPNGGTDFASSISLVGHHFHSKRFCALDSTEADEFLPSSFPVKGNILDCSKNQLPITAASNE